MSSETGSPLQRLILWKTNRVWRSDVRRFVMLHLFVCDNKNMKDGCDLLGFWIRLKGDQPPECSGGSRHFEKLQEKEVRKTVRT
jgi:hypothetical protein